LEHAWKVAVGNRVAVRLNVPDVNLPREKNVFEGRITFVDVTVQPVTRQTRVFAVVSNRANILRAGLTADMSIQLNTNANSSFSADGDAGPRDTLKVPVERKPPKTSEKPPQKKKP
jgi:hypothetical protein